MMLTKKAIIFIIFILLIIPQSTFAQSHTQGDMNDVFEYLKGLHVSGVNEGQLSSDAINGMIRALGDPYTDFFTKQEWTNFQGSLNQSYVGVGMRLGEDQKGIYVVEVFPGSPAQSQAILRGDYIIAVNGKSTTNLSVSELIALIVGPEGTNVLITIQRLNQTLIKQLTRQQIQIPIITSKWFTDGIGYIKLSGFSENADAQFKSALEAHKNKGAKGLIIDLRGNPGGFLHITTNIAKNFIEDGILINTSNRNQVNSPIKIENGDSVSFPVVVLVDRDSASASEILAGALQDYELATIIGTPTFGKGSVQSLITFATGSVLKVTTEEYFTPKFHPVNQKGITPDIIVQGTAVQMLTALHTLGVHDLQVSASDKAMSINGVSVMDSFQFIIENNKVYIHSRVLAALIDGLVKWNGPQQAVKITKGMNKVVFLTASQHVKLKAGTSFIELDYFKTFFPNFNWSFVNGEVQMSYKTGNTIK